MTMTCCWTEPEREIHHCRYPSRNQVSFTAATAEILASANWQRVLLADVHFGAVSDARCAQRGGGRSPKASASGGLRGVGWPFSVFLQAP